MHRTLTSLMNASKLLAIALLVGIWFGVSALWAEAALAQPAEMAEATIYSTSDPTLPIGVATFAETGEGLAIQVSITDAPSGYHGFHVHENGRCEDGGQAAGGHFNPMGVKHGWLKVDGFEAAHAGDLGNILIDSNGGGSLNDTIAGLPLTSGAMAIAGKAVILHENRDDFGQPTGNAGGRIGCGLIELSR